MKPTMTVTVLAPAKINLTLDVTGRRDDGYHLIHTVMQSIDLCDRITVKETGTGDITLDVSDERVPSDERNTAYRAAQAFFAETALPNPGIAIRVQKRIPMEAGLAGGSADAAGVLVALNILTDARLETDELCRIGGKIGADVPFCVLGGAANATGTGTILSPLPSMPDCWLTVAKPDVGVSTAEAYRRIDAAEIERRPLNSAMIDALCGGELAEVGRLLCNVFQEAVDLPEVAAIAHEMREQQTLGCAMTGSGSAVFGIFEEKAAAKRCADLLKRDGYTVFVCRPCTTGPVEE